jgi:hypothetical protein
MDTYGSEDELHHLLRRISATTIRYQEWKRKNMKDNKERIRIVDIEVPKGEFMHIMKQSYRQFADYISKVIQQ